MEEAPPYVPALAIEKPGAVVAAFVRIFARLWSSGSTDNMISFLRVCYVRFCMYELRRNLKTNNIPRLNGEIRAIIFDESYVNQKD